MSRVRSSQTPHHGGLPLASISLFGQLAATWPSPLQSKHLISKFRLSRFDAFNSYRQSRHLAV